VIGRGKKLSGAIRTDAAIDVWFVCIFNATTATRASAVRNVTRSTKSKKNVTKKSKK
jgi:hypothetical protein